MVSRTVASLLVRDWLPKFVRTMEKKFIKNSWDDEDDCPVSTDYSGAHINLRISFILWAELRNLHVIVSRKILLSHFSALLPQHYGWTTICPFGEGIYCINSVLGRVDCELLPLPKASFTDFLHFFFFHDILSKAKMKRGRGAAWLHRKKSEFIYDFNYHGDYGNILPE